MQLLGAVSISSQFVHKRMLDTQQSVHEQYSRFRITSPDLLLVLDQPNLQHRRWSTGESGSRCMAATAMANVMTPSIVKNLDLRPPGTTRKISLIKLTIAMALPPFQSLSATNRCESNSSNQPRKRSSEDIPGVQNRYSCFDLLPGIEDGQQVSLRPVRHCHISGRT
jgi:hypothetical protein